MLKLFKYLKPYTLKIAILAILVFGTVATTLQLPDYMAKIIDKGVIGLEIGRASCRERV